MTLKQLFWLFAVGFLTYFVIRYMWPLLLVIFGIMIYGYFQLNSVLEAMKKHRTFEEVIADLGIHVEKSGELSSCTAEVNSRNAGAFLSTALQNMKKLGIIIPDIGLELVDNPMIQQAREG